MAEWFMYLFHVNDYIDPMVIFTAWVKIYSMKYFCNARLGDSYYNLCVFVLCSYMYIV